MVVAGPDLLPNHGTVISTGTTRGVDRRASLGESVGRPPGAPKVLGSLMAVSGPNYGPAAHPRRGDEAPRRAAAPRHARPGRRVAAGAARPYRVTSERSRPPPAAAVPRLPAGPVGRGSRPHLPTSRRPCRTRQRRAIVRARRRRRGRRCEPASGGNAERGLPTFYTTFVERSVSSNATGRSGLRRDYRLNWSQPPKHASPSPPSATGWYSSRAPDCESC